MDRKFVFFDFQTLKWFYERFSLVLTSVGDRGVAGWTCEVVFSNFHPLNISTEIELQCQKHSS
jgi:hypothetical protein